MNVSDGMNYAPKGKPQPVVKPGEFVFSAVRLDHGHIYGMCNGLTEAGGTLKYVYDPDEKKVEAFLKAFPQAKAARSEEEALGDPETHMIAGAAITSERCALGLRAMNAGKDYFTDKAPFTTLEQLESEPDGVDTGGEDQEDDVHQDVVVADDPDHRGYGYTDLGETLGEFQGESALPLLVPVREGQHLEEDEDQLSGTQS